MKQQSIQEKIIGIALESAATSLLNVFKLCELQSLIEARVHDEETGDRFIITFRKITADNDKGTDG